jgi:predicted RNA-binding protein with PUA-like domain
MAKWLVKSEPSTYSIDDLRRDKKTVWDGVRNYQARNYLRQMAVGDEVFVYHSNAEPPSVVGVAVVSKAAAPDPLQFDPKSEYYDPAATSEAPRWFAPELRFKTKFASPLSLDTLRSAKGLEKLPLVQKGTRLSVMPVSDAEFEVIVSLAEG